MRLLSPDIGDPELLDGLEPEAAPDFGVCPVALVWPLEDFCSLASLASRTVRSFWSVAASLGSLVLASSAFFAAISTSTCFASSALDALEDVVDVEPNKDDTVEEEVAVTIFPLPIALLVR